ncbi:MAG: c-type heme family protein [Myxococcota bacterium]
MNARSFLLGLFLASGACAKAASDTTTAAKPPPSYPLESVPPELTAPVQRANAAMQALMQKLVSQLLEELGRGGPQAAVKVCRDVAQPLTAQVAAEQKLEVGRTSHRLRNPKNAPRAWARPFVEAAAGKKASEVDAVAVDLGDRVGVLRPIPVGAVCTQCHGNPAGFSPALSGLLREAYPQDEAVGFSEGDLRGFFWAEIRK